MCGGGHPSNDAILMTLQKRVGEERHIPGLAVHFAMIDCFLTQARVFLRDSVCVPAEVPIRFVMELAAIDVTESELDTPPDKTAPPSYIEWTSPSRNLLPGISIFNQHQAHRLTESYCSIPGPDPSSFSLG